MTSHSRLSTVALILALAIIGGFFLSVPRVRDVDDAESSVSSVLASTTPLVSLHTSFKKGVHTITGSVWAPNACTSATVEATLTETSRILLDVSMPEDTGLCLEVPTEVPFSTSVTAPEEALVDVRVNGVVASTTGS